MAIRRPFNWSLLTREVLFSMLNSIQSKVIDKRLSVEKLHDLMSKHIKKHLPVKVRLDRDSKNDKGYVYVGGAYYSDFDRQQYTRHIEVIFSYNSDQKYFNLSRHRWVRLCTLFADTMLHEIIHARQYRSRNYKTLPGYQSTAYYARDRKNQNYYGDTDEIGAFAFNIACDLIDRFGEDFDSAAKYLDSNEYKRHKQTFGHNHSHPIVKRIKKKAISYLPNAYYVGKPFRTTDWLTY
jgi:hypothetical protein